MNHFSKLSLFKRSLSDFLQYLSSLTYSQFDNVFSIKLGSPDYNSSREVFSSKGIVCDGENFALEVTLGPLDLYLLFPEIGDEEWSSSLQHLKHFTCDLSDASDRSFSEIAFYTKKNFIKQRSDPYKDLRKARIVLMDLWLGANPQKPPYPILPKKILMAIQQHQHLKTICQKDSDPFTQTIMKKKFDIHLDKVLLCVDKKDGADSTPIFDEKISRSPIIRIGKSSENASQKLPSLYNVRSKFQESDLCIRPTLDIQFLFSDQLIFSQHEPMPQEYRTAVLSKLPNIFEYSKKSLAMTFLGLTKDLLICDPLMISEWHRLHINKDDSWYDDVFNTSLAPSHFDFIPQLEEIFQAQYAYPIDALIRSSKNLASCPIYLVKGLDTNTDRECVKIEELRWKHYCLDPKKQKRILNFDKLDLQEIGVSLEFSNIERVLSMSPQVLDLLVNRIMVSENHDNFGGATNLKHDLYHDQKKRIKIKDEIVQFMKDIPVAETRIILGDSADRDHDIFELFSIDKVKKQIAFHNLGVIGHQILSNTSSTFFLLNQPCQTAKLSSFILGQHNIQMECHAFQQLLHDTPDFPQFRFQIPVVTITEVSPKLILNTNAHGFRVVTTFRWNDQKVYAVNMGPELIKWLGAVAYSGLSYLSLTAEVYESENYQSNLNPKPGLFWDELFLSRIVAFSVILESLSYVLDKTDSEGNLLRDETHFFENLNSKLLLILEHQFESYKNDCSGSSTTLSKLIGSDRMIAFENLIRSAFLDPNVRTGYLVIDQKLVCVEGFYNPQMRLVLQYFKALLLRTKGRLLKNRRSASIFHSVSARSNLTDREIEICKMFGLYNDLVIRFSDEVSAIHQRHECLYNWIPLPQKTLSECTPFPSELDWIEMLSNVDEIELHLNGKKLEKLDPDRFKVQFHIGEDHDVLARTGKNEKGAELLANKTSLDWFELHPQYHLDGVPISESEAQNLIRGKALFHEGNYYLLNEKKFPMAKTLTLFWETLRGTSNGDQADATASRRKGQVLVGRRHSTLDLLAFRAMGVPTVGPKRWSEICDYFDGMTQERDLLKLPPHLETTLKHYQRVGVQWLYDLSQIDLGGILADDMGLGKTLQVLAFLSLLKAEGRLGPTMVVVPTSLVFNWMHESQKFTPELEFVVFDSKQRELSPNSTKIVIVTYGVFCNNIERFKESHWDLVVLDEAQSVKAASTQRYKSISELPARIKIALTGTPFENHLGELYNVLNLVAPGALGRKDTYNSTYVHPSHVRKEDIEFLKLKIKPLILRRRKSEILKDLPAKREITLVLPFEKLQKKIYRDIALSWNDRVRESIDKLGAAKSQIVMLTALGRLRQVCSDPAGIPRQTYKPLPPKVEDLVEKLSEIVDEGQSALVFTQFLSTFNRIEETLLKSGIGCFSIHGGTSRKERERILHEFGDELKPSVLLMTLKTGGVGLNLTKASFVFHIEPWWNPAVENQATDRAYRMGQTREVQIFRYIMQESVEEKIQTLKTHKSAVFEKMLDDETIDEPSMNRGPSAKPEGTLLSEVDFRYLIT